MVWSSKNVLIHTRVVTILNSLISCKLRVWWKIRWRHDLFYNGNGMDDHHPCMCSAFICCNVGMCFFLKWFVGKVKGDLICDYKRPWLFHGTEENTWKHRTAMHIVTAVSDIHKLYITGQSLTNSMCWYPFYWNPCCCQELALSSEFYINVGGTCLSP